MAAAGLAELLGASPEQFALPLKESAWAYLGLTCDPVAGQVQVRIDERNAIASVGSQHARGQLCMRPNQRAARLVG